MYRYFIITSFLVALISCNRPDFSLSPYVEYDSFERTLTEDPNSIDGSQIEVLTLKLYFQDGDGDLGIDLDTDDSVEFRNNISNLILKRYRLESGEYVIQDTVYKTFDRLITEETAIPIDGILEIYDLFNETDPNGNFFAGDSIRYEMRIMDRELNYSNWTLSPPIFLNVGDNSN